MQIKVMTAVVSSLLRKMGINLKNKIIENEHNRKKIRNERKIRIKKLVINMIK